MSTNEPANLPISPLRGRATAPLDMTFYDNVRASERTHRHLLNQMRARRTQSLRPLHPDVAEQDTVLVPVATATVVEMPFQRDTIPFLLVEAAIREFWLQAGHPPMRVIVSYWNRLYLAMCGCETFSYGETGEIAIEDDRQRSERLPHNICIVIGNT